jgi:hypothetical protein
VEVAATALAQAPARKRDAVTRQVEVVRADAQCVLAASLDPAAARDVTEFEFVCH